MSEAHPHLKFLISETKDLLVRQLNDVNAIDTKASILLGADALLVTTSISILVNLVRIQSGTSGASVFWIFIGTSFFFFLLSVFLAMMAYTITTYKDTINPRAAYENWSDIDQKTLQTQYLHNIIDSYEENARILKSKSNKIKYSLICLAAAVICGVVSALVYFSIV